MADRVKIVDVQVNIQDALAKLSQYNQRIDEARSKMRELQKALKDNTITQKEYSQQTTLVGQAMKANQSSANALTRQIQTQITVAKAQVGSLNELRASLSLATREYDALSAAERNAAKGQDLKAKINVITDELKKAEGETQRFYRNIGNYKDAANGFDQLKSKVSGLGKELAMLAGAGTMAQLGKNVVQITRDFDDGMARVRSVLNADAATMQALTDKARELGRTTMFHATDAAQAMENLARGGFNASESLNAVSQSLKLAQANAVDLDTSSDLLIRTMRGFGLTVNEKELAHASDVLSSSAANSATNIVEIGEALKNAAPPASALKLPIEEINAALMVLADRGVRGSDAGTAMRMVMLGLASPTSAAGKLFKEFNINISQAELATKGFAGVLDALGNSGIMSDPKSFEKLSAIFGRRAVMNVISLMDNIDQYQDKLNTLYNSNGTTDRMFNQSLSEMSNQLYTLSSAWEDMMITMGEKAAPMVTKIADAMTQGIYYVQENFNTIVRVIGDAIAGFTLYKLVTHCIASGEAVKLSVEKNLAQITVMRQESEAKTIALKQQETQISNTLEAQKAKKVNLSEEQITLFKKEQALLRERIATEEANFTKLKQQEAVLEAQKTSLSMQGSFSKAFAGIKNAASSAFAVLKGAFSMMVWTALAGVAIDAITSVATKLQNEYDKAFKYQKQLADKKAEVDKKIKESDDNLTKDIDSNVAQRIAKIEMLNKKVHDNTLKLNERQNALNQLKKLAPGYNATLTQEGKLYNDNIKTINEYIKALQAAAIVKAGENLLTQNVQQRLTAQSQIAENEEKTKGMKGRIKQFGVDEDKGEHLIKVNQSAVGSVYGSSKVQGVDKGDGTYYYGDYYVADANGKFLRAISKENAKKIEQRKEWIEGLSVTNTGLNYEIGELDKQDKRTQDLVTREMKKAGDVLKTLGIGGGSSSGGLDEGGDGGTKGGSKTTTRKTVAQEDKDARGRKRRMELEDKYTSEAEKAQLDLLEDTWEKRRAVTEQQYDSEIRKLKTTLDTEKNLTEKARTAINNLIKSKEQQKQRALDKLSDEEMQDAISRQMKLVNARLSIARKGSEEEFKLQKQKRALETTSSLNSLETEREGKVRGSQQATKSAQSAYNNAKNGLGKVVVTVDDSALQAAYNEAKKKYQDVVAQWQVTINDPNATDDDRKAAAEAADKATAEYVAATNNLAQSKSTEAQTAKAGATTDKEKDYAASTDALAKSLQAEAAQVQYYADMKFAINEEARQKNIAAEQSAQDELYKIEGEAMSRRIALLQQGYTQEQIDNINAANAKYEQIVQEGVREGETEQEFEARKSEARVEVNAAELEALDQQQREKRTRETLGLETSTQSEREQADLEAKQAEDEYNRLLERGQLETQTTEQYEAELAQKRDASLKADQNRNQIAIKDEQAKANSFKAVGQSTIDVINAVGQNSETMAKVGKVIALAEIAVNTGKAIAEGVAQSMKLGWPAAIPAIATMVATVMANIATAISTVKSAKFAQGGKVIGPGTGTSDSISAQLSNGEYVMTAKATKMFEPLLAAMNGIGAGVPMQVSNSYREVDNPDSLTESFATAAQTIRPVVSVEEITDAQSHVQMIQNTDTF